MLSLQSIKKDYLAGEETVHALKGVSLDFRTADFVSILGPSGCGKTTLLNIVGGLDRYTDGDLFIGGRSTKDFTDRDWDTYRNHTVGFVFQSYNLIPHQSVLQNVELALSLSGVSKAERHRRAAEALKKVGLGSQLRKRPSELSGGQMQRVAIARALVNDPEIILADEPTGALDTETGIQVMELLKEISRDRLVIMVTHNPELADRYSTRIIRMLDGEIKGDTRPLSPEERAIEAQKDTVKAERTKNEKKPSMSFKTSFGLSLKNLFTKKARTALTAFAGSIGIIGIALIFAVSQGMTAYINSVQEETLASYPLTLEAQSMDLGSLMQAFAGAAASEKPHENDAVYQKTMIYNMVKALNDTKTNKNDLGTFKDYLEEEWHKEGKDNPLSTALSGVQYSYKTEPVIYTKNESGKVILSDSTELMQDILLEYFGMDLSGMVNMGSSSMASAFMPSSSGLWQEMLPAKDGGPINELITKQYDLVYGSWPNEYNEVLLVLDSKNELDDMTLYALGLKSKAEIDALMQAAKDKTDPPASDKSWSYEEICAMEFKAVFPFECYSYNEKTNTYDDLRKTELGLDALYAAGTTLKISGIIRPAENAISAMLTGDIVYTYLLTEHLAAKATGSPVLQAQLSSPDRDVLTGLLFHEATANMTDEEKQDALNRYVENLPDAKKAEVYVDIMSIPSEQFLMTEIGKAMMGATRESMEAVLAEAFAAQMSGMSAEEIGEYLSKMPDKDIQGAYAAVVAATATQDYAQRKESELAAVPAAEKVERLSAALAGYTPAEAARYYEAVAEFSPYTYEDNLEKLGYIDLDSPDAINLYASSFENKDIITDAIAAYNEGKDELQKISYTDYVGLMMSSITTVINAITYVLIAFVAVSLVVSSIMIGVITLISVQERTKEIGILRALGASKRNVSGLFNAETVMIGFASGVLGVGITYLLCIPINLILRTLTGIPNLGAVLPLPAALLFVAISVLLTLVAGIIPSRSAAKKDPVVALRTE
ncbi:MAG: ABC transporter ATP-binding protein/permease [Clostridia bacterium]|nr:ABC transporter ATP-binding protein/permease [Clostridia bacterium]